MWESTGQIRKHAWALQILGHLDVERGDLDHTPEAVEAWAAELGRRFGGRPIAVALEQSRGSLLFMLTKYAHLVLFPVHPTTLYDYRKGFRPSGAKKRRLKIGSVHHCFGGWGKDP